jgi:hypothetical protein
MHRKMQVVLRKQEAGWKAELQDWVEKTGFSCSAKQLAARL